MQIQPINNYSIQNKIKSECDISKFTDYIFSENSNGKKFLFESWGFSKYNSCLPCNFYAYCRCKLKAVLFLV